MIGKARDASPKGWIEDHTFTDDLRRSFELQDAVYPTGEFPVVRDSGEFVVKIANTTWNLTGVAFDTPAPNRQPRYSIVHRERTADETKECDSQTAGRTVR